jgi:ABC-type nitrate/sulfonate/bicarbonate transport system substrate-binding protein
MIEQAGQGRLLMDDSGWNPYAVINAMIVRRDWADKNPNTVIKLVKVAIETGRWIDDHPDEAREIIGKGLGLSEPVYRKMRMSHFPRNGYQLMPSIWEFYHLMLKAEQLQPFNDARNVVRKYWIEPGQRFIVPALSEIGIEPDPVVAETLRIRLPNLPEAPEKYYAPWEQ